MQKISWLVAFVSFTCLRALAGTLSDAVWNAPMVVSSRQQMEAAVQRLDAAGRWTDPELEGMYSEKRMPDETNPMWEVNLVQPLPKYGERAADRDRAQARAHMARADLQLMAATVAAEVSMALADRDAAIRRRAIMRVQQEKTARALAAVEARIGAGQSALGESLALKSRLASMLLDLDRETLMADEAEREARRLLGLAESQPLPDFSAPQPADIDPDRSPETTLIAAQKDEARAMRAMARAEGRPMTAVGLRFEREEAADGNEDTVGVALMTELPWNSRRYARAEAAAAEAELAGRDAETESLRWRIEADRTNAARFIEWAEKTRISVSENLNRLDREYDAWIASTGTTGSMGASSVLMLVDLLERGTMLQIQSVEAESEALKARAALWKYVTMEPGESHE